MQTCSKCHAQSPDYIKCCTNCASNLEEWSETAMALKRIQDNPRVIYVRISVADKCCPACRQVEGAYDKQMTPKIPIEGCSHEFGCSCFYQPVLDSIYP